MLGVNFVFHGQYAYNSTESSCLKTGWYWSWDDNVGIVTLIVLNCGGERIAQYEISTDIKRYRYSGNNGVNWADWG